MSNNTDKKEIPDSMDELRNLVDEHFPADIEAELAEPWDPADQYDPAWGIHPPEGDPIMSLSDPTIKGVSKETIGSLNISFNIAPENDLIEVSRVLTDQMTENDQVLTGPDHIQVGPHSIKFGPHRLLVETSSQSILGPVNRQLQISDLEAIDKNLTELGNDFAAGQWQFPDSAVEVLTQRKIETIRLVEEFYDAAIARYEGIPENWLSDVNEIREEDTECEEHIQSE